MVNVLLLLLTETLPGPTWILLKKFLSFDLWTICYMGVYYGEADSSALIILNLSIFEPNLSSH